VRRKREKNERVNNKETRHICVEHKTQNTLTTVEQHEAWERVRRSSGGDRVLVAHTYNPCYSGGRGQTQ
jgi:hypothetical protein